MLSGHSTLDQFLVDILQTVHQGAQGLGPYLVQNILIPHLRLPPLRGIALAVAEAEEFLKDVLQVQLAAPAEALGEGHGHGVAVVDVSEGVGVHRVLHMDKAGAVIVFNDQNQEALDRGVAAYKEAGIEAHGYICDVTDEEGVQAMVASIEDDVGVIDILVNNAGIIKRIPMLEMSAKDFRQVIDVDLNGPFIVSKAVIPSMIKKGGGKIINICSMMSELGRETVSAYAAAKGGLKMLTRNIASEYGQYNIQCNGIGPGYIATPQTAPLLEIQPDGSKHPFDQFILAKTPANRWGEASDLGGPAVFLASSASDFVNGHILYVDGGILAYIGKQPQGD